MANQTRSPVSLYLLTLVKVFDEGLYRFEKTPCTLIEVIGNLQITYNAHASILKQRNSALVTRVNLGVLMQGLSWRIMLSANLPVFLPLRPYEWDAIQASRELLAPYLLSIIDEDSPEHAREVLTGVAPVLDPEAIEWFKEMKLRRR
jgi:hypothetical protein